MGLEASFSSTLLAIRTPFSCCIQRRFSRLVLVCSIVCVGLVFHLTSREDLPAHHAPFEAPATKLVVHGDIIDDLPEPSYALDPFPYSPKHTETTTTTTMTTTTAAAAAAPPTDSEDPRRRTPPWLAAVISTASDVERRMLIRSTWMRLYRDVPFDGRFVVANPGPRWTEVVANENRTFGDMIVLDHIAEDDVTANTVKTLEFYKWLANRANTTRYEFVSKMDTDLWLNARGFWDRFLLPMLSTDRGGGRESESGVAPVERTVIGQLYYSRYWDLVFPHGAMYTVTWDMMELLSSLQSRFNVVTGEDMAVAILMLKGRERANFVNFRGTEKFDYSDADARHGDTAWARDRTHPDAIDHALVGGDAIAVHQLKDEELWFQVADCFDEDGIKEMPPQVGQESRKPMSVLWHDFWYAIGMSTRYTSRFDRIPDFLWTVEDGDWICDGIWNLGKRKSGYLPHHPDGQN